MAVGVATADGPSKRQVKVVDELSRGERAQKALPAVAVGQAARRGIAVFKRGG